MSQNIDEIDVIGSETYLETGKMNVTKTVISDDPFNDNLIENMTASNYSSQF